LEDENQVAINKATLGTLYVTHYYYNNDIGVSDKFHLATIASRYNQVVYAGGSGSMNFQVLTAGTVIWEMQKADNAMLSSKEIEMHKTLLTWQWAGKQCSDEILFYVKKVDYSL
jgi:hypothetical protein